LISFVIRSELKEPDSMCVISDQLLLATNPSSTSKPSAVDSVKINKQKLWDQLDEVCQHA